MRTKLLLAASLVLAARPGCGSSDAASSRPFEVKIAHSAFLPGEMSFEPGDTVTFVIENADPIDHEFILGDDEVQQRHEKGRDKHHHGEVAGEVSVPAGETRETTYTFTEEGTLIYGCHLPRHYDYGMRGEVEVG